MTTISNAKPLELTVSNFGPIAEASIELRPMSVFVGPSNTGKSYTAALVYALHRFFNSYVPGRSLGTDLSENDIEELYCWGKKAATHLDSDGYIEIPPSELPEFIAAMVRPILNRVTHLNGILDDEIARCFGVYKAKNLDSYPGDGGMGFSLRGGTPSGNRSFGYKIKMTEQGAKIDALIPNTMSLRMDWDDSSASPPWLLIVDMVWAQDREKEVVARGLLESVAKAVVSEIVGPLARPAHYLPADRAGVMHAHQVAVRGLIASASRAALRPDSPMPVLSGVLGDFMEQLVALADSSRRAQDEDYDHLAQNLEQTLLRGAVRVEQSPINYPSFVFQPNGWKRDLPLMNASSMVSELAPVVLYLRHVVQPGDLLIIEEPESHLHPAMQVEFTRQLAAAVQSGVRILITTHSEWVLEELANLVRLSELPKERRTGIDDENTVLSPDQVGAWFFEPSSEGGGSVVREILLDTESATFPAGFGLVTESLYNRWAEISARIQEA